jgi:transcriptional regulator with XRE-family HTH domain
MISPLQCKLGRTAVGWTVSDLAEKSGVTANTVSKFETMKVKANPATVSVIQRALEEAGVVFTRDEEWQGVKVRYRV